MQLFTYRRLLSIGAITVILNLNSRWNITNSSWKDAISQARNLVKDTATLNLLNVMNRIPEIGYEELLFRGKSNYSGNIDKPPVSIYFDRTENILDYAEFNWTTNVIRIYNYDDTVCFGNRDWISMVMIIGHEYCHALRKGNEKDAIEVELSLLKACFPNLVDSLDTLTNRTCETAHQIHDKYLFHGEIFADRVMYFFLNSRP
jgi:hypothetical protein